MNLIGSALDDGIHHATGILTSIGAAAGDHAYFLNSVERQARSCRGGVAAFVEGGQISGRIRVGCAIHKKGVGTGARSIDCVLREGEVAILCDTRQGQCESRIVTVSNRKGFNLYLRK